METVSEKPRRGRPPVFTPERHAILARTGDFDGRHSRRAQTDRQYYWIACLALGDGLKEGCYRWLHDPDKFREEMPKAERSTVLVELGRLWQQEAIREVAAELCASPPRTSRAAVAIIRRARLGKASPPSEGQLAAEILAAVNAYLLRHPDTTARQMQTSLARVFVDVERHRRERQG